MTINAGKTPLHTFYPGSGLAPEALDWEFEDSANIVVVDSDGATLTEGTHYSISGDSRTASASITPLVTVAASVQWIVRSRTERKQTTEYDTSRVVDVLQQGRDLDRLMMAVREQDVDIGQMVRAPIGENGYVLPAIADMVGKFLGVDLEGNYVPLDGTGADAGLRSDLAAQDKGGTLVAFLQEGTGAILRSMREKARERVSVTDFGAVGDAAKGTTGVATAGDATFTDASAAWTADDVGKAIVIGKAGTGAGAHSTTIAAVVSATEIELADVAVSTVASGARYAYGTDDFDAFDAALDHVYTLGGGTVNVPKSAFLLSSTLKIGANTKLALDNGAILYKAHADSFLNNGRDYTTASDIPAYEGHGNITVEGGIWEGYAAGVYDSYTTLALGFGTRIRIKGCVFRDGIGGGHFVDMSVCDDVVFEDCRFEGYALNGSGTDISEVIQLDHNLTPSFPYFGLYKGKPNKNITVRGCYFGENPLNADANFGSFYSGVGGHGAVQGEYAQNILIEGCTFDDPQYAGVRVFKWKNATIRRNTFLNATGRCIQITATAAGSESSKDINGTQTNEAQACDGIIITENLFDSFADEAILTTDITFGSDTTIRHSNVTVSANDFRDGTNDCVDARDVRGLTVANNQTANCARLLITAGDANEDVVVTGNKGADFSDTSAAIALNLTTDFVVAGNQLRNMQARGVLVTSTCLRGLVSNNTLTDFGLGANNYGIVVQSSSDDITVMGNSLHAVNSTNTNADINASSSCDRVDVIDNLHNTGNVGVLHQAASGIAKLRGTGTPEGVVTAQVGSQFSRTNGGAGTSLYIKESGTGNTGWAGV